MSHHFIHVHFLNHCSLQRVNSRVMVSPAIEPDQINCLKAPTVQFFWRAELPEGVVWLEDDVARARATWILDGQQAYADALALRLVCVTASGEQVRGLIQTGG